MNLVLTKIGNDNCISIAQQLMYLEEKCYNKI